MTNHESRMITQQT